MHASIIIFIYIYIYLFIYLITERNQTYYKHKVYKPWEYLEKGWKGLKFLKTLRVRK